MSEFPKQPKVIFRPAVKRCTRSFFYIEQKYSPSIPRYFFTSRKAIMGSRDKAANQLQEWKQSNEASDRATNRHGCPVPSLTRSLTAGKQGPILLQDTNLVEHLAQFDRERIPERVVHAKGAGAFGFIHTQKRNPQTHLKDADMFWDFISLRPETTHQVSFLFSDRGTPDGYRQMNGYGSHTFKLVNAEGTPVYCKFHLKTDQGIKNLPTDVAGKLEGEDPDHAIRDLYNAIATGNNPSWSFYIQVMTFEQAETYKYNPFDLTKVWPHTDFPLIPVGKVVLNRNPQNYFAEVEQIAFSPANMVPGIEASPDKMLQGRLFSYSDTHRHRLGANYAQLPVNCPHASIRPKTYSRDGPQSYDVHQGGAPNYFPNSFNGPHEDPGAVQSNFTTKGDVQRYDSGDEDNFSQVDLFWTKVLSPEERQRLVNNIAGHLKNASEAIRNRALVNFGQVNPEYAYTEYLYLFQFQPIFIL
ncbi:unnamed protein product [Allacma fusca]|uniref:Catalase core domain-containing protein n=1 Tax=Allacma fusca TaxID=39272 RepID=A0A8J2KUS4_9HEXA|nr:unnamed protein product [Allacma fusca]